MKNWRSENLSEKEISRKFLRGNSLSLKSKKIKGILREKFILLLLYSAMFCLQNRDSDFILYILLGRFYQSSFANEVFFRDIMNVSPNILAKNQIFKKFRHGFVDQRALITTKLISPCHWKTLVSFWLRKKRPKNAFLTLLVNHHKIVRKNKLYYPKQEEIGS